MSSVFVRAAQALDASSIASIYNEGIADRSATFETEPRGSRDFASRLACAGLPLLVAEADGRIVGWAGVARYSDRKAYAGVGEMSIYVHRGARQRGIGTRLCQQVIEEAALQGFYKLLGKLFPENTACIRMAASCGFRDVGIHRCHGRLDGRWRDVLLIERLLGDAEGASAPSDADRSDTKSSPRRVDF